MVSIIIPARNEVYLEKTIRSILENAEGKIEIIVELDGWVPDPTIHVHDMRVIFYHHPESIGQRACINHGATIAKGEYIMKLDAHCAVDKGFDVKLAADCEYDWTVIPRMYNLDVTTWKPKLHKLTDYMYISSPTAEKPFRAEYYGGDEYKRLRKNKELIDDTMACMGPCFFMHKDRFWELGGCDEGHIGGWGQQGVEVSLKAWLSGGSLKVNKKTWFSHWFRGGSGPGFPYHISGKQVDQVREYSRDLWLNNKWEKQVRPIEWLVEKFNPPTWSKSTKSKKLSVIIPSYKDPLLHKTISSILDNFEGDFEIIPVIDGYELQQPIVSDLRVKPVYLKDNVGMRGAINAGVAAATGDYIMRTDEHCMFSKGFDKIMLDGIQDNWILTARRYYLDPVKWEVMQGEGYVDYEKLIIKENPKKFSGVKWINRTKKRSKIMVDETMMMQGSCWIMSKAWWNTVIKELQVVGYGPHYQDTTEMIFKTWQAGGKLMLNKNAWFAHKHRSFNRTHQYPTEKAIPEWFYALGTWLPTYEKVRIQWGI